MPKIVQIPFWREKYSPSEFLRYSGGVGESSGLIVEVDIEEDQFMSTIKPTAAVEVITNNYTKLLTMIRFEFNKNFYD